jgi:hypothetical protein
VLRCAVPCCAVLCCAVLRCAVLCRAAPCYAVLCRATLAVLCCAVPCLAVLCRAVPCCTVLCRVVLCCSLLCRPGPVGVIGFYQRRFSGCTCWGPHPCLRQRWVGGWVKHAEWNEFGEADILVDFGTVVWPHKISTVACAVACAVAFRGVAWQISRTSLCGVSYLILCTC